jgi:hypothetical protein
VSDIRATFDRAILAFAVRVKALDRGHVTQVAMAKHLTVSDFVSCFLSEFCGARARVFGRLRAIDDVGLRRVHYDADSRALSSAVLQSSFVRWADPSENTRCLDLVGYRTRGCTVALGAAEANCVLYPPLGRAGMASYLSVFSKRAAVACARLRFNRSHLGDSLQRRRMAITAECSRCGSGVRDSVEHFLHYCPGEGDTFPLAVLRTKLFYGVFRMAGGDDVRFLLGEALSADGIPPGVSLNAATAAHLRGLGKFYDFLSVNAHSV